MGLGLAAASAQAAAARSGDRPAGGGSRWRQPPQRGGGRTLQVAMGLTCDCGLAVGLGRHHVGSGHLPAQRGQPVRTHSLSTAATGQQWAARHRLAPSSLQGAQRKTGRRIGRCRASRGRGQTEAGRQQAGSRQAAGRPGSRQQAGQAGRQAGRQAGQAGRPSSRQAAGRQQAARGLFWLHTACSRPQPSSPAPPSSARRTGSSRAPSRAALAPVRQQTRPSVYSCSKWPANRRVQLYRPVCWSIFTCTNSPAASIPSAASDEPPYFSFAPMASLSVAIACLNIS